MNHSAYLKIIAAVVLFAVIGAILLLFPTADYLTRSLEWIQSLGAWGPVCLAVVYVVACVLFIPGSILTLGAGFLFKTFWGTVTVSIGSVLGATAAFLVGRSLLRGRIEQKLAANAKFRAIDRAVGRQGFKIVLLTRLSPVFPFNLLNYAFGLTNVSLRDYVVASWIGMLPGTIMYVYFGSAARSLSDLAAGKVEGGLGQQVLFGVGLILTVVVTVFVTRIAKRALDEATAETEAEAAVPDSEETSDKRQSDGDTNQPPITAGEANV